jgi:chromosome segregation ATPase
MIKVSPGLARIIKSFGKAQTSLPSANGTKIVIRNPELLRIIRAFGKASNQVKSSPLSLRSADNANYSEVQALKDRIAKLINEKEYLKGQYDQQKKQDEAFYDNLRTQYNNLQAQHNNLNIQYGNLTNQVNDQQRYINRLKNDVPTIRDRVQRAINDLNHRNLRGSRNGLKDAFTEVQEFLNQI